MEMSRIQLDGHLPFSHTAVIAFGCGGISVALIPLLHATIGLELWQLLVLVFPGALVNGLGRTARQAHFPNLIQRSGMDQEQTIPGSR